MKWRHRFVQSEIGPLWARNSLLKLYKSFQACKESFFDETKPMLGLSQSLVKNYVKAFKPAKKAFRWNENIV